MDPSVYARDIDADGGSPKRLKTNEQSALPVSILKDAPFVEAVVEKPVDPQRNRKSLGRRVSFAPTAHVRMFEAPDEKQVNPQASNSYVMPDLSSQTGMVGFNLGALSTIDDTSMNSNGSFDVSVRNSDMSGSAYSSEGSFATSEADDHTNPNATSAVPFVQAVFSAGHSGSAQQQNYANILDEDDDVDEDSLDDDDGEDDAVTMELTGTVDMGAIDDGDSDNDLGTSISISGGGLNARDARHDQSVQSSSLSNLIASGTQLVSNTNTEQILNALLQSNTASQDTSLLDNIILQFSQHPQSQSHQQQQQQPESPNGNIQNTMELDYTRVDPSVGMEDIYDRDTTIQPDTTLSVRPAFSANDSRTGANGASLPEYEMDVDSSDDDNINEDAITMELTGVVSRDIVALQSNPVPEVTENQGTDVPNGAPHNSNFGLFDILQLPSILPQQQQQSSVGAFSTPNGSRAVIQRTPARTPASSAFGNGMLSTPVDISSVFYSEGTAEALSALFAHSSPKAMPQSVNRQSQALSPAARAVLQIASIASSPSPAATPVMATPRRHPSTPGVLSTSQRASSSRRSVTSKTPVHRALGTQGTPLPLHLPGASHAPAKKTSPLTSSSSNPFYTGSDSKIGKSIKADAASVFELDPLPHIPLEMQDLPYPKSPGSSILADQAKAGLVFDIYNAYRYQQHIPQISADAAEMTVVDAKFEPLYRKAKLTARLEYCSSLVSLFESDQAISRLEDAAITDFGQKVAFFSEANEVLLERKDELVMRLAKLKSRIAEESSAGNTGRLSVETKELREKLAAIKSMREETSAKADQLSCEIRALQTTNSSFDRQVTEKKSAQKLLLAINGLQLADVSESSCEFVYDKFSKLHLDGAAEFTSLHPDINWNAIVRDAINRDNLTLRQYAISIMRLNAILNDLLDDVKRVKRHTFVDVFCNDGIQVRMQLFSKELRRRFYLHVPLKSVESYKTLHSEPEFDWSTEAVYGNVDQEKLRGCLNACVIDSASPLLSIYQHLEACMESY